MMKRTHQRTTHTVLYVLRSVHRCLRTFSRGSFKHLQTQANTVNRRQASGVTSLHCNVLSQEERPLLAVSSRSQIRRRVVLHRNSYGRFRLGAALQLVEKTSPRQAATGQVRSFCAAAGKVRLRIKKRAFAQPAFYRRF